jgi:hypothetical protein
MNGHQPLFGRLDHAIGAIAQQVPCVRQVGDGLKTEGHADAAGWAVRGQLPGTASSVGYGL